jgi:hypothetical protein
MATVDMHEYKGRYRRSKWHHRMKAKVSEKGNSYWEAFRDHISHIADYTRHHFRYMWKKMSVSERVRFTLAVKENIEKGMDMDDAVKRAYKTRSIAVTGRIVIVLLSIYGMYKLFAK